MDALAGYIATIIVSLTIGYFSQFLTPRPNVVFWPFHQFTFTVPFTPPNAPATTVQIVTHAISVQNIGRRRAEDIEIVHATAPSIYAFWPSRVHSAEMRSGVHVISIAGLGPGEGFTLEFLSIRTPPPQLQYIRSKDGQAQQRPTTLQWVMPPLQLKIGGVLLLTGAGLWLYWLIRAGQYVWHMYGPPH